MICLDEALNELRGTPNGTLPLQPGQPIREDDVFERNGAAHIFPAVKPLRGQRFVWVKAARILE